VPVPDVQVNSGVDWFGIDGAAEIGDSRVGLRAPRAIKQGDQAVRLDDGSSASSKSG
jgi:hypothetical protein